MLKKKKKPSGRPFKKGNLAAKGNKSQKAKPSYMHEELRALNLDKRMLVRYLLIHSHLTIDELKGKYKNPLTPTMDGIICKMLIRLHQSGDVYAFNALMDRTIGPVTMKVELDRTNRYASMTDEELLLEKRRLSVINEVRLRQIENKTEMYYLSGYKEETPIDVTPAPIAGDFRGNASGE